MKPIFLIGLMGSGKTYWGQKLAQHLNLEFIDLDLLIENQEGKTIAGIFKINGEQKFRELETTYLKGLNGKKNTVIALGGGTPCFNENMLLINESGISFYLKTDLKMIVERLAVSNNERPLIKNKSKAELMDFFEDQLKTREAFYSRAKYVVEMSRYDEPDLLSYFQQSISG